MVLFQRHYRQIFRGSLITLVAALSILGAENVLAASQDSTVFFRPHCDLLTEDGNMYGPVPDVEGMVGISDSTCPRFDVENPQTLKTIPINPGDVLNFDIAVNNPSGQPINHVRSWIAYDTSVFEGVSAMITPNFPIITPGEADFDHMNGYIMIEGSNDVPGANAHNVVSVANIQLRVKIAPPSGTFISFYDVQPGGHTAITTQENGNDEYVLGSEPGGLHVVFVQQNPPPPDQSPPQQDQPPPNPQYPPPEDFFQDMGNPQQGNNQDMGNPQQGNTNPPPDNQPPPPADSNDPFASDTPPPPPANDGSSCMENFDCMSGNCSDGICVATDADSGTGEPPAQAERTAFTLLQVRNLRATTEGSSVFLAWDELNSSSLKAYNVYFGTTTGRYIQRKTIDGSMKSVILRSLPLKTTYYFAIRAISTDEEESAFSREVAVEVGDPNSSTSPLVEDAIIEVVSPNPVGDLTGGGAITVPGETGPTSVIALMFILCAAVGTVVASKRQMIVTTNNPTHE